MWSLTSQCGTFRRHQSALTVSGRPGPVVGGPHGRTADARLDSRRHYQGDRRDGEREGKSRPESSPHGGWSDRARPANQLDAERHRQRRTRRGGLRSLNHPDTFHRDMLMWGGPNSTRPCPIDGTRVRRRISDKCWQSACVGRH